MKKYRIRKLTPRECWRLMGFSDKDFNKAQKVNSNTQLYAQAGNSIVVDVLEAIFSNMIENKNTREVGNMNVIEESVEKMIDKELEAANERFPLFTSNHEAYAVTLEEANEASEEMNNIDYILKEIWSDIKHEGHPQDLHEGFTELYNAAVRLATEAIQTAAMARKSIMSNEELSQYDD